MKVARYEFKFYINQFTYHTLRNRLKYVMHTDGHSVDDTGYLIRSVYFDSYHDRCYSEKLLGAIDREKYRLRLYNHDPGLVKFEIKEKKKNVICKHSYLIDQQDARAMIDRYDYDWLLQHDDKRLRALYGTFVTQMYRPKVLIDYVREAYTLPYNNIRITFDKSLSSSSAVERMFSGDAIANQRCMEKELMILEVKYNTALPQYIQDVLVVSGVYQRSAISKYIIGREPYYAETRMV